MKVECVGFKNDSEKYEILNSLKFKNWFTEIEQEMEVSKIELQSVDWFKGKAGFIKIRVTGIHNKKEKSSVCFIRGNSVSILFVLQTEIKRYAVLVEQFRAPIGKTICECPAGMMDEENNIQSVAMKEIEEELEFSLNKDKLLFLDELYNSPGGCDEKTSLFAYIHHCTEKDIVKFQDKKTGVDSEDITVKVVPFEDFERYNKTATGIASYYKLINYKNGGRI